MGALFLMYLSNLFFTKSGISRSPIDFNFIWLLIWAISS